MPGFTWLQRLLLTYFALHPLRNKPVDPEYIASAKDFTDHWFGIMAEGRIDPKTGIGELVTRRADLWIALTRKPWKIWHRFKHYNVSWAQEHPQRAALLYLDAIVWALVLGLLIG